MHSNRKAWIAIACMAVFFATLSVGILIGRAIGEKSALASLNEGTVQEPSFLASLSEKVDTLTQKKEKTQTSPAETKKTSQTVPANGGEEYSFESNVSKQLGSDADKAYVKKFFTEYTQDAKFAKLVEENYYSLIDAEAEDDFFAADVIAVTGEGENFKILVDITVKDKKLASQFESLSVEYYNLGAEQFAVSVAGYGTEIIYGTKDPEQSNLFHCALTGFSAWLVNEQETVVAFRRINLLPSASSGEDKMVFLPDIMLTFVTPASAYCHGTTAEYFTNTATFEYDGVTYHIYYGQYFMDGSHLDVRFSLADTPIAENNERFSEMQRAWLKSFREAIKEMYVVADGVTIDLKRTDIESYYFSSETGKDIDSTGYMWIKFAPVDFKNADQLELHLGDQVTNLKYCKAIYN